MEHSIHRVIRFEIVAPYTLQVTFDDNSQQVIDFRPVLAGELFGPLKDKRLFEQVEIDPEVHTLVWPNGADFDPATLYYWSVYANNMKSLAKQWADQKSKIS